MIVVPMCVSLKRLNSKTIDKIKNKPATEIESKFGLTKFLNREYLEVLTNYSFKQ